jgi:RNA polymerase sigma-70 factor (ECF subfamily)
MLEVAPTVVTSKAVSDLATQAGVRSASQAGATTVDTTALLELLYRQLRALAGPRPDLDDIVQAAALRALKSLDSFEGRSQFSTWTYGVCYRTLLDHDRWGGRFRRRFSFVADVARLQPRSKFDSEAQLLQAERARRLHAALDRLPDAKRAVLVLHDLEGLSAPEVAEITKSKEGTVRSRLRDGRRRLSELLRDDPLFDPEGSP